MAHISRRLPENTPGSFYVDSTCIDCDTCRWLAPEVFVQTGDQSAVGTQPVDSRTRESALQALVACPTASIGVEPADSELGRIRKSFPIPVDPDGEVLYCGYHSEKSFGASSYFLPAENILIDCPREAAPLIRRLEELGGVEKMLLTHGDDVADHAAYHKRFACGRFIHTGDHHALREAEVFWSGKDPISLEKGLLVLPVPGHTCGSCCFLYRDKYLFTGDHLAYSERRGHLYAFRDACWYSWQEQIASMEKLLDYSFEWVLPGHGRRVNLPAANMRINLEQCLKWMKER